MLRKVTFLTVLSVILCLLSGCGGFDSPPPPEETTPSYAYSASTERWVYIEFDPSYDPEQIRMNLTTASGKDVGKEIGLTYDPSISGCIFSLDAGTYCVSLVYQGSHEICRYFVVDDTHSYYHIRFTP
jgi:hypothetical protein